VSVIDVSVLTLLTRRHLSSEAYEFIDALITQQTSPEEAFRKLDDLATKHTDTLRKFTKQVQDARTQRDQEMLKRAIREYDEALERCVTRAPAWCRALTEGCRFIPVLMAMAKIYWDRQNYPMVEKIFRQSVRLHAPMDVCLCG
jgi:tetratricopeptide repeat protein 30